MSLLGATIILAMLLLLPLQAHAEIWRCHHPNGSDFITAGEQNPGACVTFRIPDHPPPLRPQPLFPGVLLQLLSWATGAFGEAAALSVSPTPVL